MSHPRTGLLVPLISFVVTAAAYGQQPGELLEEDLKIATENLEKALAGPTEEAFLQVLVDARVVRNELSDTVFVYDLVARYDPARYRNDRVGIYPLSFEDQFILWGKRIALYSRSTDWESGSFYLRDIGTARETWISTEDCRRLYRPSTSKLPPIGADPVTFKSWLRLIYRVEPGTELRTMSRWLQLLKDESRTQVLQRLRAARLATESTPAGP